MTKSAMGSWEINNNTHKLCPAEQHLKPGIGFDTVIETGLFKYCGTGLKSNQKEFCYSHDIHAIKKPVGICCQDSHNCSSHDSQLVQTDDYFFFSIW